MAFKLEAILKFKDDSKSELKGAEQNFDGLKKAAMGVGVAVAGAFAAEKIIDIAKMGAQAERVEERFGKFAKAAGGADAVLDAFSEGVGGAASKMESMESASRLLQMGLIENADEMGRTAEMASRLGDQTQSVGDRVSDWAAMLANQSIPRLDNFGISSGKVRERILELTTTMGMAREEAFKLAVFEEGAKSLEVLGERSDDSMMSFEKLDAKIQDLTVELGKALAPALVAIVDVLIDVVEKMEPWLVQLAEGIDLLQGWGKESREFVASVEEGAPAFESSAEATEYYIDATNRLLDSQGDFLNIQDETLRRNMAAGRSQNELAVLQQQYERALTRTTRSGTVARRELERYNQAFGIGVLKIDDATAAQIANNVATEGAAQDIQDLAATVTVSAAAWESTANVTRNTGDAYVDISGKIRDQEELWQEMTDARIAHAAEEKRLAEEYKANQEEMRAANRAAVDARKAALEEERQAMIGLIGKMGDVTEESFNMAALAALAAAGLPLEAYANAGLELGIFDEKQIAAAKAVDAMTTAMGKGLLSDTTDFSGLIADLWGNLDEANPRFDAIIRQYLAAPTPMSQAKLRQEELNDGIERYSDDVGPGANRVMGRYTDHLVEAKLPLEDAMASQQNLNDPMELFWRDIAPGGTQAGENFIGKMEELPDRLYPTWEMLGGINNSINTLPDYKKVTIDVEVNWDGPSLPAFQHGGTVPGPVGAAVPILAHGGEIVYNPYAPPRGNTISNTRNFNLTINTRAPREPIISDFRMMQAMMG